MKVIQDQVDFKELWAQKEYDLGDIIKIVVDVEKKIIGVDAEMHADIEQLMLDQGSFQEDLWGANLVYGKNGYTLEYTSFINIRPAQKNRAMEVKSKNLRKIIENIIKGLIL